jgi:hypothetical protein
MQCGHGKLDAIAWNRLTEKDNVGLKHATAALTVWYLKIAEIDSVEIGIAIGCRSGRMTQPIGIQLFKPLLMTLALCATAASQTNDRVQTTMQINHRLVPGPLVQAVYILGDQKAESAGPLECREGHVNTVRFSLTKSTPPNHRTRPVSTAGLFIAAESLPSDGRLTFPLPRTIPVIRNT